MKKVSLFVAILLMVALSVSGCALSLPEPTPAPTPVPTATPTPTPSPTQAPTPVPEVVVDGVPLSEIMKRIEGLVATSFDGYSAKSSTEGSNCELMIYGDATLAEAVDIIQNNSAKPEQIEELRAVLAEVYSICDLAHAETIGAAENLGFENVSLTVSLFMNETDAEPLYAVNNDGVIARKIID